MTVCVVGSCAEKVVTPVVTTSAMKSAHDLVAPWVRSAPSTSIMGPRLWSLEVPDAGSGTSSYQVATSYPGEPVAELAPSLQRWLLPESRGSQVISSSPLNLSSLSLGLM